MITTWRPQLDTEYAQPAADTTAAAAAETIRSGDTGPRIGAFFDLDGTLVRGYTAGSIYRDRIRRGEASPREIARMLVAALDGFVLGDDPQTFGAVALETLRGRTAEELGRAGERVFVDRIAGRSGPRLVTLSAPICAWSTRSSSPRRPPGCR